MDQQEFQKHYLAFQKGKISRRRFMQATGLATAAAVIAACAPTSSSSSAPTTAPATAAPASSAPTTAPATAAPSAAASAAAASSFPPAGEIEKQMALYSWSDYDEPQNIEDFKAKFGVTKFQYDTYASNEEMIAKFQAGGTGWDIAVPTSEYIPAMVEGGYIQKIDWSRIPNAKYINPSFLGLPWDPTDEYHVGKHFGTTGILVRTKVVKEPVTSWKDLYDLTVGKYSGKVVFVDSMGDIVPMALKMGGKSANSAVKEDLDAARLIMLDLAPHLLALDTDTYGLKLASEEAVLALGWTGEMPVLRADPKTADIKYVLPSEGSIYWLDSWVLLKDAPNPNAAYAWLNFIQEPERAAKEVLYNGYGSPNDGSKEFLPADVISDPIYYPTPEDMKNLEGLTDQSGNQQRIDIWGEFKSKIGS